MKNLNPVVCTLTNVQRALRGQSWRRSLRRFARRVDRLPNGVLLELRSDVPLGKLRELVAAEAECCRWMNLELRENALPASLTITADTDEGVRAIVDMMTP
jgi:hypothetical protein